MKQAKEISEELKKLYPIRLELHAHTSPASKCANLTVSEVLNTFKADGYDGIAITNHFFAHTRTDIKEQVDLFRSELYHAMELGEKIGIKVYAGAELCFVNENNNDYLLFGYDPNDLYYIRQLLETDVESFVKNYKTDDMLLIQAHPFRNDMERTHPELMDGYEAFNMHPNHNSRVAVSVRFANEQGKIMTMGTDFHHPNHDNLCATRAMYLPENEKELVKLLKSDNFIFEIGNRIVL